MIKLYSLLLYKILCLSVNAFPGFHTGMTRVKDIPLPEGYKRVTVSEHSFAGYLQNLPLRKDKTVYFYNHQPKPNQSLHYAVIDISTGDKDLQQCADAIMRLRAEYFFEKKQYDSIRFPKGIIPIINMHLTTWQIKITTNRFYVLWNRFLSIAVPIL